MSWQSLLTHHLSIKEILSTIYIVVWALSLVGIRFESDFLNTVFITFLLSTFWFLMYLSFSYAKAGAKLKGLKIVSGLILALLSLLTVPFILITVFEAHDIATDGNWQNVGKMEIQRLPIRSHIDVVVYQMCGGATVDLCARIYRERFLGLGLKRVKLLGGIYHASDIDVKKIDENSISVSNIVFTSSGREQEYYAGGGTLKIGSVLSI